MNIKQRRLPSAYQEVEWIGADGNQYIDTGITPSTALTTEYEYGSTFMAYSGAGLDRCVGGLRGTNTMKMPNLFNRVEIQDAFRPSLAWLSFEPNILYKYSASSKNGEQSYTLNDETTTSSFTKTESIDFGNLTICVFALGFSPSPKWFYVGRIYNIWYKENGVAKFNLIPCYRISDSVIGMYDTVNGTFYTNQGTGTFTKGADVITLESMTIPDGNVIRINDGNGNLLWKKHLYDFKEFCDKLVEKGETIGTDENGRYVTCTGSIMQNTVLKNLNVNKSYQIYIKGYNINTSLPRVSNIGATPGGVSVNFECSLEGVTTQFSNATTLWGRWTSRTAKIYDLYLDEI